MFMWRCTGLHLQSERNRTLTQKKLTFFRACERAKNAFRTDGHIRAAIVIVLRDVGAHIHLN